MATLGEGRRPQPRPRFDEARGFFTPLVHAVAGTLQYPGFPARWANRAVSLHRNAPPLLGEHGRTLLAGLLGIDDATLDEYEATAIIGTRPA